jgi:Ser/Thr protein kinase RdoA (MazF antagonist)
MFNRAQIHALVKRAFPTADIDYFHRSPVAQINWVYRVKLKNPDKHIILRINPEHHPWKIDKEKKINKLLSGTGLPLPDFIHVDSSKDLIPHHYQIMECLPGERWSQVIGKVDDEKKRKKLYFELGKTLGKINSVKLDQFGWIHSDQEYVSSRSKSWKEVFFLMTINELLDLEQKKFSGLTPIIRDYVDFNQNLLDIEIEPRLLHNDFFEENILVHNDEISGVIDFEWAFAGHNEFELAKVVSQLLLDYPSHEYKPEAKDFFRGYKEHGSISRDFEARRHLYTLYHLIHWANHCTKNRQRCIEAGINVDQVMGYFYNDIKEILK